jgi:DNA-directed RNA polymerase subunit RPC12/RpoP
LVRDRLPNTSVIDPATLDVKKAVTEKALVRCPHCGQAHCLAISSGAKIYFMERDFHKNDFGIIAKFDSLTNKGFLGMCCKTDTNKLLYFKDLQDAALITQEDFAATDETEIFCPVCHQSESFYEWKNAYINPLDYFETEHICDVCGGETVVKPDAATKQKSIGCETCGHTKPLEG